MFVSKILILVTTIALSPQVISEYYVQLAQQIKYGKWRMKKNCNKPKVK